METFAGHVPIRLKINRPIRKYTLEEYLRKEAKSEEKHEYINGQIIKMPNAKGPHNIISGNMIAEMKAALKQLPKKYIVFPSDQKVYFPSLNEGVYADTLAVCEKPLYWDDAEILLINPIIVVEVLSKSTQKYDRFSKFDKYKTLESIREYVLIRQDECYAEVWHRLRPGFWQETIITDINDALPLQSVGVSIPMQNIYENVDLK
ncbi:MAG: Uma2 family endonuclease [Spirosomaceae bacterium]|jgi:Uma2 family endonuclease|nr:Uma2 family endonuclease [Spirosomataceae bacterium]